jgi:hypothetical protein
VSKEKQTTRTRTITGQRELQKVLRTAGLTREEELVLRMRHGIVEPKSAKLEFRGQSNDEMATKLAMIEHEVLANMGPRPVSDEENLAGEALKSSIIDQLKEL